MDRPVQWGSPFDILIIDCHIFDSYKVNQNDWLVSHCSHMDNILFIVIFNAYIGLKHIDEIFNHFLVAVIRCKV